MTDEWRVVNNSDRTIGGEDRTLGPLFFLTR